MAALVNYRHPISYYFNNTVPDLPTVRDLTPIVAQQIQDCLDAGHPGTHISLYLRKNKSTISNWKRSRKIDQLIREGQRRQPRRRVNRNDVIESFRHFTPNDQSYVHDMLVKLMSDSQRKQGYETLLDYMPRQKQENEELKRDCNKYRQYASIFKRQLNNEKVENLELREAHESLLQKYEDLKLKLQQKENDEVFKDIFV